MRHFCKSPTLIAFLSISTISQAAPKKPVVFTENAKLEESYEQLLYPAVATSQVNSQIRAEADGLVKKIHKNVGEKVRTGDLLFTIQNTDPAYSYAPLKVRAYVAGTLGQIQTIEGTSVQKGDALANIVDPSKIKLVVEVPAADVEKVKSGHNPVLVSSTHDKEKIPLKLLSIAPAVDPNLGTARAEYKLLSPTQGLVLPGSITKIEIQSNPKKTFIVAQDSVVYREGKEYLRKVVDNKVIYVPVELGKTRGENVEIDEGLNVGDVFVVRSSTFVADGESVEIFKKEPEKSQEEKKVQAR